MEYFNDSMGGSIEYSVAYLSNSTVQGNYKTASALYGTSCDIIYNATGIYCLGVAKACTEAGGTENGRCLMGIGYDQYPVSSQSSNTDVEGYENLMTPMGKKIRGSIVSTFDRMAGENCEMNNHRFSLTDGGVGLAYSENYHKLAPEDVQK